MKAHSISDPKHTWHKQEPSQRNLKTKARDRDQR